MTTQEMKDWLDAIGYTLLITRLGDDSNPKFVWKILTKSDPFLRVSSARLFPDENSAIMDAYITVQYSTMETQRLKQSTLDWLDEIITAVEAPMKGDKRAYLDRLLCRIKKRVIDS